MVPPKIRESKQRLKSDERRLAILETAVQLFAEVGFRAATTKALAARAGVSEALLYQHFPSKEALYSEVQEYLCEQYPAFEEALESLPPSTDTLVFFVYLIAQLILDPPSNFDVGKVMPRIMLQSLLDDGTFARMHLERNMRPMIEFAARSVAEARKTGDLLDMNDMPNDLRFLLSHHVIVMIHLNHLPAVPMFDYPVNRTQLLDHAVRFALSGMGMTSDAIKKFYNREALQSRMQDMMLKTVRDVEERGLT